MAAPIAPASPDIPSRSAPEADFDVKMFALFKWATDDFVGFMEGWRAYLETNSTIVGGALNSTTIGQSVPAAAAFTGITAAGWAGSVAASGQGAVIERGGNSNGDYLRLADGTQICTITTSPYSVVADSIWSFPALFSTAGGLAIIGNPRSGANATKVSARPPATSSVAYNHWGTANERLSGLGVSLVAIGRWF